MSEPIVLNGLTLHPELAFLLDLRRRRNLPPLPEMPIDEVRALTLRDARAAAGEPTPVEAVTDLTVDGATGPLRARLYQPEPRWSSLLVLFHGGGFVFGDVDSHDGPCRLLCASGGYALLSVEYRLAPEHPHPAAVDDAWSAWQWVLAHATTLPGTATARGQRIAIGGDSAGGLLAAVVCQLATGAGVAAPVAQMLIYPAVSRERDSRSMELFSDDFLLTRADMDFFERSLSGGAPVDPSDTRRNPLRGQLAGLPPALVITAGFDPLRDKGEEYAAALQAAGTPAVLRRFDQLTHGFINLIGFSPACRAATMEIAEQTAGLIAGAPLPA